MGRHKIPLKQKLRNAIVAYGDQFIKQDGDTVTCIKCPKAIPKVTDTVINRIISLWDQLVNDLFGILINEY